MDEITLISIAAQLRKPDGEWGAKTGEFMNVGNRLLNERAIDMLDIQNDEYILEIGMGNGLFVKDILDNNSATYAGCDYSQVMVDESERINKKYIEDGRASFHMANITQMPFDDNTYDKIFTANTIYFWDEPTDTLAEIKRVLKPNGELLIAMRPKRLMKTYPMTQYGFTMYEEDDLRQLFTVNGFEILELLEQEEPQQEIAGNMLDVASLLLKVKKA